MARIISRPPAKGKRQRDIIPASMTGTTKTLTAEHFLLTTLVVKVAVVAVLSTMLVRFPWFRRILLTEKRDWPERLIFAASLGFPLTAGVVARLLINYNAADLTLAGAFLAGLLAGPYAGAIVGSMLGIPALIAGEWIALPFAIGCGFAGGGLREICPKAAIWHFSPLFFMDLHRNVWRLVRRFQIDWVVILMAAPIGLEIILQALGSSFKGHVFYHEAPQRLAARPRRRRHGAVRRDPDQDLEQRAHRAPAPGAGEAADGGAGRSAREPDQPAFPVQHPHVDLVADPLAAGNRAHADREAVRPAAAAPAKPGALRDAARGAGSDRRVPRHREHPLRPEAAHREVHRSRQPRPRRPQHAAAAARREFHQARALAEDRRGAHHDPQQPPGGRRHHRRDRQRRRRAAGAAPTAPRRAASASGT